MLEEHAQGHLETCSRGTNRGEQGREPIGGFDRDLTTGDNLPMVGVNARYAVGRDAISHWVYSVIGVIAGRLGASVTNSARAL